MSRVARFFVRPEGKVWLDMPIPDGNTSDAAQLWAFVKTQGMAVHYTWALPIEMIAYMVIMDDGQSGKPSLWGNLPTEGKAN